LYTKARFNVVICKATIGASHTSLLLKAINLTLLRKIHLWWLLKKRGLLKWPRHLLCVYWWLLLKLYNHTNHQVAALNIWETSWPAYIEVLPYISLPLLPHLTHLAADTTLYGSLSLEQVVESRLLEKVILFLV
jgi:hypothetical protein